MFSLSDKTKSIIEDEVRIPYDAIITSDIETLENELEETHGAITYPDNAIVDGYPIRTMEYVDSRLNEIKTLRRIKR